MKRLSPVYVVACLLLAAPAMLERRPHRRRLSVDHRLKTDRRSGGHTPVMKPMGSPDKAKPVDLGKLVGAAASVIRKRVKNVVTIWLIDQSGSMFSFSKGDMRNVRGAVARSVIGLQRSSGGGKCRIFHWGSGLGLVTGFLDVKRDTKKIKDALSAHPSLGGNNLPLALRAAAQSVGELRDDEVVQCFAITDGIEAVTDETRSAITALPKGSCHLILVDRGNGCSPEMEADWRSAGFGSVTRLNTFDTREMAEQIAAIYAGALGLELAKTNPEGDAK